MLWCSIKKIGFPAIIKLFKKLLVVPASHANISEKGAHVNFDVRALEHRRKAEFEDSEYNVK